MAFQTRITRRARFVVGVFTAENMASIGEVTRDSVRERIRRGENVTDGPAKRLTFDRKGAYGRRKVKKGLRPERDWTYTGETLKKMVVKSAAPNRAVIAFEDDKADLIANVNNRRDRQFGLSPKDSAVLQRAVYETAKRANIVQVKAG